MSSTGAFICSVGLVAGADDGAERDLADAARALEVDPDRSNIICSIGKKGSGKSEACRQIFDAWPYDRVVLDVTGDARPDDPATVVMTAPIKGQMPAPVEGAHRVTVWARLTPKQEERQYLADQDNALALGLYPRHRNTLVWVDEYAQMATPTRLGPNLRLALQSSRHYHLSMLLAFPRPRFVPVITLAQADKVLIFQVPHQGDRQLIAENIGFPVPEFERRYRENIVRDPHAYLLWDSHQNKLFGCPPLPLSRAHGPRA